MKRRNFFLAFSMALVVLGHTRSLQAQDKKTFKPEELDQMLAPIALYSDALLAQMLMAASYPLEMSRPHAGRRPIQLSREMPPPRHRTTMGHAAGMEARRPRQFWEGSALRPG